MIDEDFTLYSDRDIRNLVIRQLKEERKKVEPNRFKVPPPKPKKRITTDESAKILKATNFSYAFTAKDLFYGYKKEISFAPYQIKKLKFYNKKTEIEEILGDIFAEFVTYVMKDIIENNITFKVPAAFGYADIHLKTLEKDDFIKYRKLGQYLDIDFIKSNFKVYRPTFYRYKTRDSSAVRQTDIIIDQTLQKELTQKINHGQVYYENIPKDINDYILEFKYNYPYLDSALLKSILSFGWKQIYFHTIYRRDVFIQSDQHYVFFGDVEALAGNKPELYYARQLFKRLYKLSQVKEIPWDGYYYFCLQRNEYRYYFRSTMKNGRRTYKKRASSTKYFYFESDKMLFKYPDLAYIYYKKSRYMVRCKADFDLGDVRYIRPYISLSNVEDYEYKGVHTLDSIKTDKHKYKILWAKKRQ